VATYPTVALLAYSGSRTQLIACVQGYCPLEQLLAVLATAVSEQGAVLVVERADREERVGGGGGTGSGQRGRSQHCVFSSSLPDHLSWPGLHGLCQNGTECSCLQTSRGCPHRCRVQADHRLHTVCLHISWW